MKSRADTLLTIIIGASALAVAGSSVFRAIASASQESPGIRAEPDYLRTWEEAMPYAIPIGGSETAPLTALVISDLECPICRTFHSTLTQVLEENPNHIRALHLSFALPYHRFADGAARAVECADRVGGFRLLLDAIYAKQDSLGLKSWTSFAADAGIINSQAIQSCTTSREPFSRIEAARTFAESIDIKGTPTVILNGWRYPYTPSKGDLEQAIHAVLEGNEPSGERRLIAEPERVRDE